MARLAKAASTLLFLLCSQQTTPMEVKRTDPARLSRTSLRFRHVVTMDEMSRSLTSFRVEIQIYNLQTSSQFTENTDQTDWQLY